MTRLNEKAYQAALLADAGYVTYDKPGYLNNLDWENPSIQSELRPTALLGSSISDAVPFGAVDGGRGWSESRFDAFARRYLIVYHQPDQQNGFSATLFYDSLEQKYITAFRGTNEPFPDIAPSDLLLALGLSSLDSQEQHSAIASFFENAGLVGSSGAVRPEFAGKVDFVGHSLGGYLSLWAMHEFRELFAEVFTFNGAGISAIPGTPDYQYINDLVRENPISPSEQSRIHNFFAEEGLELIANDLTFFRPGQRHGVFIERRDLLGTVGFHSVELLVDSLGVYSLFSLVDGNLASEDIRELLYGMSNESVGSLDKAVSALSGLLGDDYDFASVDDAEDFRQAIISSVGEGGSLGGTIRLLPEVDPLSLAEAAAADTSEGRGYRYALAHLLPFALLGDSRGFAAEDPAYDPDNYSQSFLNDRALFVTTLVRMNRADALHGDLNFHAHYSDLEYQLAFNSDAITYGGGEISDLRQRLAFGSRGDDMNTLLPSSRDDRLYGMAGNDLIHGAAGSDYIEGGAGDDRLHGDEQGDVLLGGSGNDQLAGGAGADFLLGGAGSDIYIWNSGDGDDVIGDYDSGGDRLLVNGIDLATLHFRREAVGSSFYTDPAHPETRLHYDGDFLTVRAGSGPAAGGLTVSQYSPLTGADYGILLNDHEATTLVTDYQVSRLGPGENEVDASAYRRQQSNQGGYDWSGIAIGFEAGSVENYSGSALHGTAGGAFEGGPVGDQLVGDDGGNALHGLAGADRIEGQGGDDLLEGGAGADTVYGGTGDDLLFGAARVGLADTLDPVVPQDQFYLSQLADGVADTNRLDGGAGDDHVGGGGGTDYIEGGTGRDYLLGGTGDDFISGGAERDIIYGDSALHYRYIELTPGVAGEQLQIAFADGSDATQRYDDVVHAGAGNDTVWGELGDDDLYGDDGDDNLIGDRYNDAAYFESELLAYGDSLPELGAALHGNDRLYGGAGSDLLLGLGGDDLLAGGAGHDSLAGGVGDDTYLFNVGDGLDHVDDADGTHTLLFTGVAVNELQVLFEGSQVFVGTGYGEQGFYLDRSQWNNTRIALESPDATIERSALDTLYFDDAGNLLLTVNATSAMSEADRDALFTVDASDPQNPGIVVREGVDELEIEAFAGGAEGATMRVVSGGLQFILELATMQLETGLDFLSLADGVPMNLVGFPGGVSGSSGADRIIGSAGPDSLSGGGGNDLLEGRAGNDRLDGGSGNDVLRGEEGDDTLFGGESYGIDTLDGGPGNDALDGGLASDIYLFAAGDGQDTISDSGGSHTLAFDAGVDPASVALYFTGTSDSRFRLEYGEGDSIVSQGKFSSYWINGISVGGYEVPLVQRSDLADGTLRDTRWNDIFEPGGGSDTIHASGWGEDAFRFALGDGRDLVLVDNSFYPQYQGEIRLARDVDLGSLAFRFDNGSATVAYGPGDEVLFEPDKLFSALDNTFRLFTLVSEADPGWLPVIRPQAPGSSVYGSFGSDHIVGTTGDEMILPGYGDDVIEAGDGADTVVLNDVYMHQVREGIGHKAIRGQGGDDIIEAPLHQGLTFHYDTGDGDDSIQYDWSFTWQHPYRFDLDGETQTATFQPHGADTLAFGAGITLGDLRFLRSADTLLISLAGGAGSLSVEDFFHAWDVDTRNDGRDLYALISNEAPVPDTLTDPVLLDVLPRSPIATLSFADGSTYAMESVLQARLEMAGETLLGSEGDDEIVGTDFDDHIQGLGGNDVLVGGRGNDLMDGGAGDDIFPVEGRRQGKDRIIGGEGYDSIRGGDGDDRIRLVELSPLDSIERIDGGSGFNRLGGTGAANILDFSGTDLLDIAVIEGRAGRDTIIGSSGDDVIDGGRGRDTLSGGAGNDTYLYAPGDGRDAIANSDPDASARDILRMDAIGHDQVWLSRKRDHLVLTVAGTRDRILVRDWYNDEANQLDAIYAGGRVLMHGQVDQLVNAMAAFDVPDGVGELVSEQARTELEPVLASVWQLAG
ncbi:MAG: hypothetical protein V2I26_16245 [Halieaceae bacterium]|jgi:Ca2+-binding RTX toxin-like protein|nr:hypothetical protein [Halieaceae bacterium]